MVNCPLASWWTGQFESAEPIARIYVKNGDRVNKGQQTAESRYFPAHEQNSASQGCPRESEA